MRASGAQYSECGRRARAPLSTAPLVARCTDYWVQDGRKKWSPLH